MLQMVLTILVLGICAYTDVKYRRISKKILAAYGVMILLIHLIGNGFQIMDLILGPLPGIFCIVISWLTRQSLGYGDSILACLCGLSLGLEKCMVILCFAFFISGIFGALMLFILKKEKTYEMPFVPFLFLGTVLIEIVSR